jgi:outer membrane protein OmpA-like peptidoglycan-associated protein
MSSVHHRRTPFLAGVLGALALAGLAALCLRSHGLQIPADISARVGAALATVGLDPARVLSVDGRDVILSGEVDRMVDRSRLLSIVQSVRGVRTVSDRFTVSAPEPALPESRLEATPTLEETRRPEPPAAGPAAAVSFPTLHFKYDSTELTDESLPLLDQVVAALKARPGMRVELAAHTDASGNPAYNLDLSARRARAVLELLKTQGIDERRLEPKGYGDTRPLAEPLAPRAADQNRRIEFIAIE